MSSEKFSTPRQLTHAPYGHILTNCRVWSPDGRWIVYDVRGDQLGAAFDGNRIERVEVATGKIEILYESGRGAHVGVATYHPRLDQVVFIHGPENPTPDWSYAPWQRRGVIVKSDQPRVAVTLDACNVAPPFVPGALRGGSHVHVWDGAGEWLSFTYEDHLLARQAHCHPNIPAQANHRQLGVALPYSPGIAVNHNHPRNHAGSHFCVIVTETHDQPLPGSDQIDRACEEAWVGTNGYIRLDGTQQERALAFQGRVLDSTGQPCWEVFIVDLPAHLLECAQLESEHARVCGAPTTRPAPPRGPSGLVCAQRRLTLTASEPYPGIAGPRHWLQSSPDGAQIAFLRRDAAGVVQLWTVSPLGGPPRQVTHNAADIGSAFTWSPDGRLIAHVLAGRVCVTEVATGKTRFLTEPAELAARPLACVFSPRGDQIAYVQPVRDAGGKIWNQIWVVGVK
ncbi:MAG: DUF3748 domain-containing protein [Pirellulales bacterium]|nr:DUF3748 domain-containing protein [Pirellulales bacterium]